MKQYYDEEGRRLGEAWSVMQCTEIGDHAPHQHNPEFTFYGPYFCAGFPPIKLYIQPARKPVN